MMKILMLLIACLVPLIFICSSKSPTADAHLRKLFAGEMEHYQQQVAALRSAMEDGQYTLSDLQQYLFNAMWLVFEAKLYANVGLGLDVEATNADLATLVELGVLEEWPGNPLHNWVPMRVLTPADGFSAGDLCLSVCPPSHGSTARGVLRCFSFDLYVYGPDENAHSDYLDDAGVILGENHQWDTIPAGALYGTS